ncbi:MAG: hypothetical protein K9H64_04645 [Bacteroidales bacterium]|nr:hypothetical protein [Bacteroidales bacterium]MCF8455107.1 hypothetical protein [Bacteroidales bacterium]
MDYYKQIRAGQAIVINSTVNFLLAYFFVVTISNLFAIYLARHSGIGAVLYHYGYDLFEQEGKWSDQKVILIFGLGLSLSLLIGVLFERWYKAIRKRYVKAKQFILWVSLISLTWFLGSFVVGAFFNFGFGAVMLTISLPFIVRILIALASAGALIGLGYYFQIHILLITNLYFRKFDIRSFRVFLLFQIIIPAFLGTFIILIYKLPHSAAYLYLDILTLATVFFIAIGTWFRRAKLPSLGKARKHDNFKINFLQVLILIAIMVLYKIILRNGIQF